MKQNFSNRKHGNILNLDRQELQSIPDELWQMAEITVLNLCNNNIKQLPKDIGKLKNLRYLDISNNNIRDLPSEITSLPSLKVLNIGKNPLREFPVEVFDIKSLMALGLGEIIAVAPYNWTIVAEHQEEFIEHLDSNMLMENVFRYGGIGNAKKLTYLKAIPDKFNHLESLKYLQIAHSFAEEIPSTIFILSQLLYLGIYDSNIRILDRNIRNLTELQDLIIFNCPIKTIPDEIGDLPNLTRLNLINCDEFHEISKNIGSSNSIKWIEIDGANLRQLPVNMFFNRNLEGLYLNNCSIISIPPEVGQATKLRQLGLKGNKITSLPQQLKNLKLEYLSLEGNNLNIPPEILEKTDEPQTILNYYFSLIEQKRKPLNELKVLLVGQGSVGKTSLVRRILYNKFNENQTKTEGISINQWTVDGGPKMVEAESPSTVNSPSSIKLNIWDFGGQEIMHATHQFFLTKRSLYLLVLDARLTQEENRVEYWLKIIQSFGGESPVLIVGNKTDQHPLDIDRTGLGKKYPNIVGILETSAATGAGIEALKAEIAKQVDTLPHVRDLLPKTWFTVKSKLEELGKEKNFITQDEYLGLCDTNDITDETSQHTLIGFLHDLGVVLHFQDDPRLEALGILNPQWVTNGVYKILNSHELFQNQGKLTLPMLNNILNLPEYPSNKRLFIVDMMKKFELCYDIETDKSFLVPDLLPKDEIYTGEWKDALAFQYHYNVLPSSIITRFIVRMNTFIHKNTIWRSGVVLKHSDNTALIKADIEERKIYIWVGGKEDTRRDLLAMIRGEFDAIHKTIAKIEATEKVPLPNAPEAAPVDLAFLQKLANEGRESLPVQAGNQIIDLIVKEVLSRIEIDGMRNLTVNIGGNVGGNFILGDDNEANADMTKPDK